MKLHFALSLFTLAPIVWAADYLSTCSDCRLASSDPPNLSCECQTLDGSDRTTTINLNTCIINAGGILRQQRRGNFAGSCDSISYSANGDLKALCRNGVKDDSDNWITINLNDVLSNFDGNLGC
ncbi:Cyanovirin-N [Aspergillus pseudodeflectus]|uniref:Cyanovirin-N n=1 Tax=Aspergillus pseudodeflectus TaxID=176178 RepID=A0ABR4JW10_9EURO